MAAMVNPLLDNTCNGWANFQASTSSEFGEELTQAKPRHGWSSNSKTCVKNNHMQGAGVEAISFEPMSFGVLENDGRILKERLLQVNSGRITEFPVLKEDEVQMQGSHRRSYYRVSNDTILKLSE